MARMTSASSGRPWNLLEYQKREMGATKTGMLGNASVLGAKSWALRILPQRKHHENEDLHQDKLDFSTKKHGDPGLSMLDFKQIGVMGGHYQTIRTFVTLGSLGKILSNSGSSPWGALTSPVVPPKKKTGWGPGITAMMITPYV